MEAERCHDSYMAVFSVVFNDARPNVAHRVRLGYAQSGLPTIAVSFAMWGQSRSPTLRPRAGGFSGRD